MELAFSRKLRIALAVAARNVPGTPTAPAVVQKLADSDPQLYAEWQRVTPAAEARLVYTRRALNPQGGTGTARDEEYSVIVWPIGSFQRWDIEVSLGHFHGPPPDSLPPKLYLHNYGLADAFDVTFTFGDGYLEHIPRIGPRESVEVAWPKDALPRAESDSADPQDAVVGKILYRDRNVWRVTEGLLYVRRHELPNFFQLIGPSEAPDRVRDIR